MVNKNIETLSRRSLLDFGAKAAATLGVSSLLAPISSAATLERACVCIYLLGGNDSNNMIVPLSSYSAYARGRGGLALSSRSLLPIESPSTSAAYGLHPALAGLQDLYNQGVLAIVANVGREDRPLTKGQFAGHQLPSNLFQHTSDSQIRYLPEGRMALSWDSTAPMRMQPAVSSGASLSQRLERVATELSRNRSTATFAVALSGFDMHANELDRQLALFQELNDGLVSFYRSLENLGISNRVTVFTSTDFNRTLAPNPAGGTDHAWGGHNLVLGGSVRGGEVYGRFPSLDLGGPDDLGSTGVWIPSMSNQQFSSTIARWYGVSELSAKFPHLINFTGPSIEFLAN